MSTEDNNTPAERMNLKIPAQLHREIKVEAAHTGKEMGDLIAEAWEAYKMAVPQPWREPAEQPRKKRA